MAILRIPGNSQWEFPVALLVDRSDADKQKKDKYAKVAAQPEPMPVDTSFADDAI